MKKIAVITATRAEFGLLLPLIKSLREYESNDLKVELVVTGTHLSEAYGSTIEEIKNTQLRIDHEIVIPVASGNVLEVTHNQAVTLEAFASFFEHEKYAGVVILGDRYEMMAVAIAAGNTRTPVFHLCGGDTTEGAMDEWIRHSITKISYLHFPTNDESYQRILQLGESPDRVFNYGSTSIDNILRLASMSKQEAIASVGLADCRYAVCTYHPVTMQDANIEEQLQEFLEAIRMTPEIEYIVTKSNADQGGAHINELLDEAAERIENLHVFSSLGVVRYLSLMKYAQFVLGNSSSGIIEAPAFGIPTINIGDRQKGRFQTESIINCGDTRESIVMAMQKAMTIDFVNICKHVVSPYGDGHAAERIAQKIMDVVLDGKINLMKKFCSYPLK